MEFTGERVVPDKTPQEIYKEHIDRYIFAADFACGNDVLDVACGTGYGVDYIAGAGAKRAVGADVSIEAVKYAQNRFGMDRGRCFTCSDGVCLPFACNSFDVVVSFETLEHISKYNEFMVECKRVLKEEGVFICSTPNKRIFSPDAEKPPNTFHVKEFWPEEFRNLLQRHFADVTLYGQCDVTLKNNSVERDRGVHSFQDDECISSAYIIAVVRKNNRSCVR